MSLRSRPPRTSNTVPISLTVIGLVCLFFGYRLLALVLLATVAAITWHLRGKKSGWAQLVARQDASAEWIRDPTNIQYPIGEYRPGNK